MDIELYNKKREELTGLLNGLLVELKGINDEYAYLDFGELDPAKRDIEDISRRVYENIFKIMLVSRFQGGKSTSFNAMLGGSCYSPMGNAAIKCSAAAITAQYVIDPQKVGATVVMRSQDELQALLKEVGLDFDATDTSALEDARQSWRMRFDEWKKNPKIFSEKERDFFFICGLILRHFDNPRIRTLLSKKIFDISLEDVGKYAKFPDDYLIRYSESGASGFSLEDVLFVFVHQINCRTQSRRLEQIGAIVEDCPGLFANTFDTSVTFQEMADASAVWYLFNARAPEESDIKAIKACMEVCKDRIFYSANIKDNQVAKPLLIQKIFPVIKEQIKNLTGESVEIHPYHALGALLYMQGSEYLRNGGRFQNESVENYLISTCKDRGFESSDPRECWRALARVSIMGMYPMGLPKFISIPDPLSEAGLDVLKEESHWDEITESIQNYVISTKAKSILITDSSEKAIQLIDNLTKLLRTREDAALQNESVVRERYQTSEQLLGEFEEFAALHMSSLSGEGSGYVDGRLASDLFRKAFLENVGEMARNAAPGILDESNLFNIGLSKAVQITRNCCRWIASHLNETVYSPADSSYAISCKGILQKAIQESADQKITGWVTSVVEGRNAAFCKHVTDPARIIYRELEKGWRYTCQTDSILSELNPVFPELPEVWTIACQLDQVVEGATDAGTKFAVKEFLSDLMFCGGGGLLFGVVCGEPIMMAISALLLLVRRIFRDRTEQLAAIESTIAEKLKGGFCHSQDQMTDHFSKQLSPLREQIANRVYAPVREVRDQFQSAKAAALEDLQRGEDARMKIAKDCREIRNRLLEEGKSYKLLQDYISSTAPLC